MGRYHLLTYLLVALVALALAIEVKEPVFGDDKTFEEPHLPRLLSRELQEKLAARVKAAAQALQGAKANIKEDPVEKARQRRSVDLAKDEMEKDLSAKVRDKVQALLNQYSVKNRKLSTIPMRSTKREEAELARRVKNAMQGKM